MNNKKSLIAAIIFVAVASIISFGSWGSFRTPPQTISPTIRQLSITQTVIIPDNKPATLSAKITPGTTALDLLRTQTKIATQGEGTQAFVTKIGSREVDPKNREYWSFEVNGKEAPVGAGSYLLQNGDSIVWLLKNY